MPDYQFVDITNANILKSLFNIWLQNSRIIKHTILFLTNTSFGPKISISFNKIQ